MTTDAPSSKMSGLRSVFADTRLDDSDLTEPHGVDRPRRGLAAIAAAGGTEDADDTDATDDVAVDVAPGTEHPDAPAGATVEQPVSRVDAGADAQTDANPGDTAPDGELAGERTSDLQVGTADDAGRQASGPRPAETAVQQQPRQGRPARTRSSGQPRPAGARRTRSSTPSPDVQPDLGAPAPLRKTTLTLPPSVHSRLGDAYRLGRWTIRELLVESADAITTGRITADAVEVRWRELQHEPSSMTKNTRVDTVTLDTIDAHAAALRMSRSAYLAAVLSLTLEELHTQSI